MINYSELRKLKKIDEAVRRKKERVSMRFHIQNFSGPRANDAMQ